MTYDPDETDVRLSAVPVQTATPAESFHDVEPASVSEAPAEPAIAAVPVPVNGAHEGSAFRSSLSDNLNDAGDRARVFAGEAADKAGQYADKAGEYAKEAAERAKEAGAKAVDRMRNNAELAHDRGTTTISNEVVEKIAGFGAREVEGVYDLGGDLARVFGSLKEKVGLGESEEENRGVSVRLEGRTAAIKITIVIEYGYQVYTVTEQVRGKVIAAVEEFLGLDVTAVDIVVDDIHIDETKLASTAKPVE
jgi:uncharacterized alkaline shock family protein YloU